MAESLDKNDKKNESNHKSVLDLSNEEAKAFFIKGESYCNIDLPPYFNFENLLKEY